MKPILIKSICTGEERLAVQMEDGRIKEVCVIKNRKELIKELKALGFEEKDLKIEF
ncbi:MAG TPA: hypothetical protein IAB12_04910 [Candidatus Ornithospirochaeta avicola]|uniref:Uncharacterized protein n=1 Tax=Candidatus Ornithospirochaeta avicola TaxID=2840896 RepID=A0A9D1PSV2_9SPIO|nr:hypothetical protein [Candidatus Ornithospirochaeta avicola]